MLCFSHIFSYFLCMKYVLPVLVIVALFMVLSCNTAKKNNEPVNVSYTSIAPSEAYRMLQEGDPLLLDVRTPGEYQERHVPGSVLIPLIELPARLAELDAYKESEILVLCRSGNRSRDASGILIRGGFKSVYNIEQGIIGWERSGYPVE